jgi:hypothetical protein
MSTVATTHRRFSDPFTMAAAVVVIVGGTTLIGISVNHDSPTTPSAPAASAQLAPNPASRIGLGDFQQKSAGDGPASSPRRGGTQLSQP